MSSRTMSSGELSPAKLLSSRLFIPEVSDVLNWLPLLLLVPLTLGGMVDLPRIIRVGSITALGAMSVIQVAIAAAGLVAASSYPRVVLLRVAPYALFLAWMIGRSVIETPDQNTLQNGLAYLLFGMEFLLAGTIAAKRPDTTVAILRRGFLILDCVTLPLVLVSFLRAGLPVTDEPNWLVGPRSMALLAIVPICWHLSGWCHGRPRAGLRAMAWFLAVVISLSRTATAVAVVAAAIAFVAHGWISPVKFVRRAPIMAVSAALVGIVLLAYAASFHERFLGGYNNVEVAGVEISASGRNFIWPVVIASAWTHPILGGGMGSSQAALWAFDPDVVGHPHNDYLRVWHDGGVVGLIFMVLALFRWVRVLALQWVRSIRRSLPDPEVEFAAVLTLVGLMLAMITDNVIVYTHVMGPSGVLIGAAAGLRGYGYVRDRAGESETRVVV